MIRVCYTTVMCPIDLEFVKTFLHTYTIYGTPDKLLNELIQRFYVVRKLTMNVEEFNIRSRIIQIQVINVLQLWVNIHGEFKG